MITNMSTKSSQKWYGQTRGGRRPLNKSIS